jgi:hypothetical protein
MQELVETPLPGVLEQAETPLSGVLEQLAAIIVALFNLLTVLLQALLPWTPLVLWIVFWLFAVNWKKLYPVLMEQGGGIGIVLIALMATLVWAAVSEPPGGHHSLLGLHPSNVFGKAVYVFGLGLIASLCGSVQLAGGCGALCRFDEEDNPAVEEAHAHSHDHH